MKAIPEALTIELNLFGDELGFFFESFNRRKFSKLFVRDVNFVQDNHSRSTKNVLRGLHYQIQQPQGKLVRVSWGCVFDVAADLGQSSPTFGQSVSAELSGDNQPQMWIPEGFAHGFLVLRDNAGFLYKTTDYYHPESEQTLLWNDPALKIEWPLSALHAAPKRPLTDQVGKLLKESELCLL